MFVCILQIKSSKVKFMDLLDALTVVLGLSLLSQFITWIVLLISTSYVHFTRLLVINFIYYTYMITALVLVTVHYITCLMSLLFLYLDVMLVTSLRDGMNLVSYEFIACQEAKKGVLVLSEVTKVFAFLFLTLNLKGLNNVYLLTSHGILYSLQVLHSHLVLELFL